jgi:hypothetical protein
MNIPITLRYQGKFYTFEDEFEDTPHCSAMERALWMYEEGNYACDCNRSLFLQWECGVSFEGVAGAERDLYEEGDDIDAYDWEWVLPCGHTIELISPRYEPILFLPKKVEAAP